MSNMCKYCDKFIANATNETYCEQCADILEKYKHIIEPFGNNRRIPFDSFIHITGLNICSKCGYESKYYAKRNMNGVMVYKCTNPDCNETNYIDFNIKEIEKVINNTDSKKRIRKSPKASDELRERDEK